MSLDFCCASENKNKKKNVVIVEIVVHIVSFG